MDFGVIFFSSCFTRVFRKSLKRLIIPAIGCNISFTESDVNIHIGKTCTAINKVKTIK